MTDEYRNANLARARSIRSERAAEKRERREKCDAAKRLAKAQCPGADKYEVHALGYDGRPIIAVWNDGEAALMSPVAIAQDVRYSDPTVQQRKVVQA